MKNKFNYLTMIIRRALIVDNNDKDKLDRIQVRPLPEFKDMTASQLPWIYPLFGTSETNGKRNIPEVDDYVYMVILDDTWQTNNMRYLEKVFIKGFTKYTDFEDISGKISDLGSQTYPQPNIFEIFADGSATIRNTETGEFCYYNSNGTYQIFDVDGNVITYVKDKKFQVYNDKLNLELKDNGDFLFENTNITVDLKENGDSVIENNFPTGKLTVSNATCNVELGVASVKVNGNLEVLI